MSDIIDKLAREAGFKHPDHVGLSEEYAYFDHKKFAELIVQECADIFKDSYVISAGFESPATTIGKKQILNHFGVKE